MTGELADYTGSGPSRAPLGSDVELRCRVSAFAAIKWHLNDTALAPSGATRDPHYTVHVDEHVQGVLDPHIRSRLAISDVQRRHSGRYRCTAFVDNTFQLLVVDSGELWCISPFCCVVLPLSACNGTSFSDFAATLVFVRHNVT